MAVAWKLYQLSRAPRDRALPAVTLCIACRGAAYCLQLPAVSSEVDAAMRPGIALLVAKLLVMDTAYWLICFYKSRGRSLR
ncbi:hypothetical protein [Streptomyces sp. NPDC089799]|uniref:hypothetical protein n=1 Tax=Streptomyces sp. NPDC089799 TaxID=3155066 RepID=UPI00341271C1